MIEGEVIGTIMGSMLSGVNSHSKSPWVSHQQINKKKTNYRKVEKKRRKGGKRERWEKERGEGGKI